MLRPTFRHSTARSRFPEPRARLCCESPWYVGARVERPEASTSPGRTPPEWAALALQRGPSFRERSSAAYKCSRWAFITWYEMAEPWNGCTPDPEYTLVQYLLYTLFLFFPDFFSLKINKNYMTILLGGFLFNRPVACCPQRGRIRVVSWLSGCINNRDGSSKPSHVSQGLPDGVSI